MFQVDIHKIKLFYMEDDGGSAVVSAVHPEIRVALRKAVFHFDKAYGIKAKKVISAAEECVLQYIQISQKCTGDVCAFGSS
jgi:hypothetical protein